MKTNCATCGKKCLSLLDGLSYAELNLLNEKRTEIFYRAGETIYKQGLPPIGLLCLNEGKAKITVNGTKEKELIVELKKPVDFLGFTEFIADKKYQTTAVAFEDSSVCIIDKEKFMQVLKNNNRFSLRIMAFFADELSKAQHKILSLTQKHLDARLAEALLEYCNLYGVHMKDGATIHTLLRRDDLAALSGMTSSSVSRTLTAFEKEGIIEVQGRRIKILDKKKLKEISSPDIHNE